MSSGTYLSFKTDNGFQVEGRYLVTPVRRREFDFQIFSDRWESWLLVPSMTLGYDSATQRLRSQKGEITGAISDTFAFLAV